MGQEGLGIVPDGFMETKKKYKGGGVQGQAGAGSA